MRFVSTRGTAPTLGLRDAVLTGLARDGGLYVPEAWPRIEADGWRALRGAPYATVAKRVLAPFVEGEIEEAAFGRMVDEAYATFSHRAVAPLVQVGPAEWLLELFHGPTLAFKDVAMQLLARMMDHVLAERGEHATIVGATSGDTGGAAIEAFRGRENTDIFILFPHAKVSDVQRLQMTGVADENVHAVAVEGDFDDCQALVKAMFNDLAFRDEMQLSGVNSINWGRIMAQIVYYATAALALGAPDRAVSFTVPTGNFGDIFAGLAAKRMGLPVADLVIATNANDILHRTLGSGRYEVTGVTATSSPSMDIQVSSNFERLLFEASRAEDGGRDADAVVRAMENLKQSRAFTIEGSAFEAIRAEFRAGRADERDVDETIRRTLAETGMVVDPHTAVGLHVAAGNTDGAPMVTPMVTLATAHPAKFPDAVEAACGVRPALPPRMGDLMDRPERSTLVPNDLDALEELIRARSRFPVTA